MIRQPSITDHESSVYRPMYAPWGRPLMQNASTPPRENTVFVQKVALNMNKKDNDNKVHHEAGKKK